MKINKDLLLPYCISIGIFNFLFTIAIVLAFVMFDFTVPASTVVVQYIIGYVVLWILNIKIIRE